MPGVQDHRAADVDAAGARPGTARSCRRSMPSGPRPPVSRSSPGRSSARGRLDGGGGYYYQTVAEAIDNDGDMFQVLDVLAQEVGVLGVFSDWPATVDLLRQLHGPGVAAERRCGRLPRRSPRFAGRGAKSEPRGFVRVSGSFGFSIIARPPWLERGPVSDHAARIGHCVAKTGQASHRPVAMGDDVLLRASISCPASGVQIWRRRQRLVRGFHPEPGPADAPAQVAAGQTRHGRCILADFCGSRVPLAFSCDRGAGPSKASAVAERQE